jgi:hypothetical protein
VARIEPYGLFILVALLVSGALGRFVTPFIDHIIRLLPGGAQYVLPIFFS